LHRITAVGFHPVPGLFGNQRRRDDPAVVAFVTQIAIELVATGSGFIDKDQAVGLRLELSGELIDVTVARADSPEIDHLSAVVLRDIRDSDGFFMDIETDIECARLWHG
jgi:hypothetical protein